MIIVSEDAETKEKEETIKLLSKLKNLEHIIEKQIKNPRFKMLIFSFWENKTLK